MTDWDNIRFFLAVAREGTLSGAARSLNVNHSTVLRRLAALQQDLSVQLFAREGTDRTLNEAGQEMLAYAERLEAIFLEMQQELSGMDTRLSGTVRLTTTDTLAATLVPSLIASSREVYPDIRVNLIVDNSILSLSRDADISLRPARSIDDDLIGRRVCALAAAVYASPQYLQERGMPTSPADLWERDWVVPDPTLDRYPVTRWLRSRVPPARVAAASTSILTMAASVRHGLGLAVLPCFLGDTQPELVRISEPIDELASALWLVTHTDQRRNARVRAFRDFALKQFATQIDVIEGRAPSKLNEGALIDRRWFDEAVV